MSVERLKNYINGSWVDSETSDYLQVQNPATEEVLGEVPMSTAADVDRAVAAAKAAFDGWRRTPPAARVQY